MKLLIIIIVLGIIEFWQHPRLDITSEGDWLIWYGNKNRKYFKI